MHRFGIAFVGHIGNRFHMRQQVSYEVADFEPFRAQWTLPVSMLQHVYTIRNRGLHCAVLHWILF